MNRSNGYKVPFGVILLTALMAVPNGLFAQGYPNLAPQQEAMQKLAPLLGHWKGEGWIEMGPNGKMTFVIEEWVEKKVQGTAYLVQGLGTTSGPDGQSRVIHEALAIISPIAGSSNYRFQTHTGRGQHEETEIVPTETGFQWGFESPGGEVRFTAEVKDGVWEEKGEITLDGGKSWKHFHFMKLERIEPNLDNS